MSASPFDVLGLSPADELSDDDVRAAWRRIAAATHPDRADGGDPERFATAAAAYTDLRTAFGRGEARASIRASIRAKNSGTRPMIRLLLRVLVAIVAGTGGVLAAGHGPAAPALAAGALTWLAVTGRQDLRSLRAR